MAITGISAISGEQIIAAGAVSAKEAGKASFTTGGNDIQNLYDTVSTNSASWTGGGGGSSDVFIAQYGVTTFQEVASALSSNKVVVAYSEPTIYNYNAPWSVSYKDSNEIDFITFRAANGDQHYYAYSIKVTTAGWADNSTEKYGVPYWKAGYVPVGSVLTKVNASQIDWKAISQVPSATTADENKVLTVNAAGTPEWQTAGGGASYTGDAQGALDEVYSNSADWNSAAAMNELPVSAGEGIDIQNVNGNIVFSCTGGSVPEGVLVESGLEYNANNEISGYSGSAFAQPSISAAEWNSNYETVNTNSGAWGGAALPISAGPGVKVELTDGKLLFSTDETVLWSGSFQNTATGSISLSESWKNFQKIEVYGFNTEGKVPIAGIYYTAPFSGESTMEAVVGTQGFATWDDPSNYSVSISIPCRFTSDTAVNIGSAKYIGYWGNSWHTANNINGRTYISKVVGINRTAGGN